MSTKLNPDRFMTNRMNEAVSTARYPLVLGLDLSLTCTGIVILDKEFNLFYSNVLRPSDSLKGLPRLIWYQEQMNMLFRDIFNAGGKDNCLIGIENYGFSEASPWTGELGGMVKMMVVNTFGEINLSLIPPTSAKLFATGKGGSPKSVVMTHVLKKWKVDFSDYGEPGEDMADAYAVARFTLSHWLWSQKLYEPLSYELKAFTPKPKKPKKKKQKSIYEEGMV